MWDRSLKNKMNLKRFIKMVGNFLIEQSCSNFEISILYKNFNWLLFYFSQSLG